MSTSHSTRLCARATLLTSAALLAVSPALAEPTNVTILHVNDLDRMEEDDGRGGVARLAGLIAAEKAGNPNVIVTNGGDAISPSLMSSFDNGAHMIYHATLASSYDAMYDLFQGSNSFNIFGLIRLGSFFRG